MSKQQKYYVVWKGHVPGIYDSWAECQLQIKAYPDARYKSYPTKAEAERAYKGGPGSGKPASAAVKSGKAAINWDSIAVDAACSGNPGVMEYQGVITKTGKQIFHQKFDLGTNNIGEFLGIVHGLALLKQQGKTTPIYTDSKTAIAWVRNKKVKTNLERNARTAYLFELVDRAENWLKENSYKNPILKWETESWGEIPADFGRK
ncbi:MAG TPA: ribonuclease H family protein [Flavilitoribacter sp.]|nr:ribonuclease H family protein [Flavilitoribacter sp.]HMQ90526.1 ribonuclease H family protein [Flavilitoribacter sp.]